MSSCVARLMNESSVSWPLNAVCSTSRLHFPRLLSAVKTQGDYALQLLTAAVIENK